MTRSELLETIRHSRMEIEGLLARAPAEERSAPVLANGWSIRDIYAHLAFWEGRAAAIYRFLTGGPQPEPPLGSLGADELNAQAHTAYQNLSAAEAVEKELAAYRSLLEVAETAPEADLFDPQRFARLGGRPYAQTILDNTAGHYEEHFPDLRGWLGLPGLVGYAAGGTVQHAYRAFPPGGKGPGVVVLHAWWGLNAFFKELCDRLAEAGFVVLAPDMNEGQVAGTVEEAMALMKKRDFPKTEAAALSAVEEIRSLAGVRPGPLGVVGFSMGAAFTVALAAARPEAVRAAVVFYGGPEVDLKQAQAAFLGHFAETDEWESDAGIRQLEAELKAAGREVNFHRYPGTGHWFFENDRPDAFNPAAAALAWERTVAFLKEKLEG